MVGWKAQTAKDRARVLRRWFELMMANQEDLALIMTSEQGKPLAESRGEIAYAAAFIEWFAEEARRVYGDLIPVALGRQAHRRHQGAGGRVRGDHAVEFPGRDDHPQGGPGAGGGLHHRRQAGLADAAVGAGAGRTGAACRRAGGRLQRRDRQRHGDRRRADRQPGGAQAHLHRLDRDRPPAGRAMRTDRSSACRSNSAATRPSSCSTTPTWTPPWRARSPRSTATPARPASAPTACWCRTASTTLFAEKLGQAVGPAEGGQRRRRPRCRRAR